MTVPLPISDETWRRLVAANQSSDWAVSGVFATGVGPEYERGRSGSLLYVGKSAGPLGAAVGSSHDQDASGRASTDWMIGRKNKSAFWQFVDRIDRSRRRIAWTNVCKMDRIGGGRPPADAEFAQVAEPSVAALAQEIDALSPQVIVFATSGAYRQHVGAMLAVMGYMAIPLSFDDGWTTCSKTPDGKFAIETRHPQGWDAASRDRVIDLTSMAQPG